MNTPTPFPNPSTPSNAVLSGAGIGTLIALVLSWALDQFWQVKMPPEISAAIGSLISAGAAYFANGGRAAHTV